MWLIKGRLFNVLLSTGSPRIKLGLNKNVRKKSLMVWGPLRLNGSAEPDAYVLCFIVTDEKCFSFAGFKREFWCVINT